MQSSAIAVRTEVRDPSLHAYIQQYPFLTGPDEAQNLRALAAVRAGIRLTDAPPCAAIEQRPAAELDLSSQERADAASALKASGLPDVRVQQALADFGWRTAPIPRDTGTILCLGCGSGEELALLRARAPGARLFVMEFVDKVHPGLLARVNAQLHVCNFVEELDRMNEVFDAVFSNHTLEHLFEPDRVLRLIRARLRPRGLLVSGLPLDGEVSVPLRARVEAMARRPQSLHALDMGVFDAGHPWKTNAADLHATLLAAGFDDVRIVQRSDVPSRDFGARRWPATLPAATLEALYGSLFGTSRAVLKAVFRRSAPLAVRRGLVALERRVAFGAGPLKNFNVPDVLVSAVAGGGPDSS